MFDQLRARRSLCIVRTTLGVKFVLVLPITARPYLRILIDRNHVRNELFLFKKGKTLLCVRVHPIIYFLRNLYDGIHVLSMATVLNVGASQSCNLGSPLHLFFLYISKDSKTLHFKMPVIPPRKQSVVDYEIARCR